MAGLVLYSISTSAPVVCLFVLSDEQGMTTTATLNVREVSDFWRVARRLHSVYAELDTTFELGLPPCLELEDTVDRREPEVMDRVRQWFDSMDTHVQVWQLRQLLQSTSLQSEENLRYLIVRHLERANKSEADKEKLDFLLVQYFAHCAPHGITEQQLTLDEVARVLEPVLGPLPESYPDWAPGLDDKLQRLNDCNSLEDLQNSGALLEVRELKLAVGDRYFEPGLLVAFTRFNFRARRAFFKAMHLDLHAIRSAVNELEQLGCTGVDCRDAGLTENESLEQVRHVVHQWKTPFRAPYSGGSSFLQLILLRHALQYALQQARANAGEPAASAETAAAPDQPSSVALAGHDSKQPPEQPAAQPEVAVKILERPSETKVSADSPEETEGDDYLNRCVADIKDQLLSVGPKSNPSVSAITLAGCKLLIATWEAQAFTGEESGMSRALQRTVAARTILHVCMERQRKGEPTDLGIALGLARSQSVEMDRQVVAAKESKNIDAAVNLAATTKRLMALIEEGEKLQG